MLLTAELLLNYQRCGRRAFLDTHGDRSQKSPPSDFLIKLMQDSLVHQQTVLAGQTWHRPHYSELDWTTGAQATLELMHQGVEQIYQGILLVEQPGLSLLSKPTLLIKQPGHSYFGDWLYVPSDIKLSKRPKLEYQIVVAFHVQLLAATQGAWPETAWLLLRERGRYAVDLWQVLPQMQTVLAALSQTLQQQEPEVFITRNRCSLCPWFNHCYRIAQSQQHLSLLPGVTPSRYPALQQLNLTSIDALAAADPSHLGPLSGFGQDAAVRLVQQAQAVSQNQAILLQEPSRNDFAVDAIAAKGPVQDPLPTATVELYFDIEAEPGLNLTYLHGVLVIDREAGRQTFQPFLAESPEAELLVWQQFLSLVQSYPTAPIFHFCAYEVQTVERLAKLYRTPAHLIKPLLTRFVDLHLWVTQRVALPVESYTLKQIANWLGFQWRDAAADGAQSIYWYTQWLQTGERAFLDAILRYNEDDCRATYHVKDWLAAFIQSATAR